MKCDYHHPLGRLRILQTTDLHMHLLGYDYFADQCDGRLGLASLVDNILDLRADNAGATLLFDNGDFLQGNPLGDILAATLGVNETHPMIAAMNCLRYDAITLGNHDFDYGVPFLRRALGRIKADVVSANICCVDGPSLAAPFRILKRDVACNDGVVRPVKIGVTGFAPPQSADRNNASPRSAIKVDDIVQTARRVVPQIKDAGADVVVALCHSGIGSHSETLLMENAAIPLATIDGLDVLLAGHTHEQFPDAQRPVSANINPSAGTLHSKPAVMAGYYGTSLGVIDIHLAWSSDGWVMQDQSVTLVKPDPRPRHKSAQRREIEQLATKAHTATLAHIRKPIAETSAPIQNYFATIRPDLGMQLLAQAMRDAVPQDLRDAPVLAAVSPFQFGGRNSLGHFIDIPAGWVTLRDAAAIFPFADTLCAVRRSGAQVKDWLERAAAHYNWITPDNTRQELLNPQSAGYHCDAFHGLTYEIDLALPARFNACGHEVMPAASRIRNIALNGRAIADDDVFIVAANSFRASGGGGYAAIPDTDIVWTSPDKLREILIRSLQQRKVISDETESIWRFTPITGAVAQFQSAPRAIRHVGQAITHKGAGTNGFETYSLAF